MSPTAVIRLGEDREKGIGVSGRVELGTQGQHVASSCWSRGGRFPGQRIFETVIAFFSFMG